MSIYLYYQQIPIKACFMNYHHVSNSSNMRSPLAFLKIITYISITTLLVFEIFLLDTSGVFTPIISYKLANKMYSLFIRINIFFIAW